ncbi:hypothetical protein MMC22_003095 [Lobaria immixta]|nr:hypothetical protein [Lobaria immixta]
MPHAISPHDSQDELDDLLIQQALDPENPFDFNRELEPGVKAPDAIDFGDLSDDDLADDEDEGKPQAPIHEVSDIDNTFGSLETFIEEGPTNSEGHVKDEFDELFGGEMPSSPLRDGNEPKQSQLSAESARLGGASDLEGDDPTQDTNVDVSEAPRLAAQESPMGSQSIFRSVTFDSKESFLSREQRLQEELFAISRLGRGASDILPPPPENSEELLISLWPKFRPGTVLKFMDLLPPKKTRYVARKPLKRPKPVQPTKVNLELAQDQEKSFRLSSVTSRRIQEDMDRAGVIAITHTTLVERTNDGDEDMESDYEHEPVGGISWQDLQIACEDWDIDNQADSLSRERNIVPGQYEYNDSVNGEYSQDDLYQSDSPPAKRRKTSRSHAEILRAPRFVFPSLNDPERATSEIAKTVTLDLNDSQLLIDDDRPEPAAKTNFRKPDLDRGGRGAFAKGLSQRYNISNDEAYDLLKGNHQSKIRSTLGNLTVEHSMPAIRLQFPYYKTKLEKQEARAFHRPCMKFNRNEQIAFSKTRVIKKKHMRGKDTQKIFETTKDLSLGDNSTPLLLEYSEEYPTMMSNFGMGSRLINYYRRKNMEDISRPKLEIGETTVLLPQDKSPFSVFGHIDPGQVTPALYNSMFRAPIFKHEPKPADFLVIRNTTGVDGPTWYIRNIENLHLVGQEFPSVDVPGPHSRKVTTASKNRLKMISYRQIRRKQVHRISVAEVTKHFTDTTDMQNRQKMKEFMQFNKEHKEWEMRPGEAIPDEETVRALVKPEDVCLLESMQVGQQHLQDAGFSKGDDDSEDDDGKEGQSVEQQLAPWYTSRNFLNAAQGKAMLQLHGEGDPSGRGEAFSFIKTSMKGGFKAMGESVEDKLDAKKLKELGGHSYNVARQQKSYEESIRRIWDAQKQSLSSTLEQSDTELEEDHVEQPDDFFGGARTPRSDAQTSSAIRRRDDETTSQFSRFSTESQTGKILRITRDVRDKYGNLEQIQEVIRDPRVIRQYLKRRHAKEAESTKLSELKPTGVAEVDRRHQKTLEKELARLERNKDRRLARDKQKGLHPDSAAASPSSPKSPAAVPPPKNAGTQRKCANCGQVGHIKTNKKYCLLSR